MRLLRRMAAGRGHLLRLVLLLLLMLHHQRKKSQQKGWDRMLKENCRWRNDAMSSSEDINEDSLLSYNSLGRGEAKKLEKLSQEGLASWQAGWKPTTAKWLLAEKEWERRARVDAAKWQRFSALMGLLGVCIGALLSLAVGILLK